MTRAVMASLGREEMQSVPGGICEKATPRSFPFLKKRMWLPLVSVLGSTLGALGGELPVRPAGSRWRERARRRLFRCSACHGVHGKDDVVGGT